MGNNTTLAGRSRVDWFLHIDKLFEIAHDGEDIPFDALYAWTGTITPQDREWAKQQISIPEVTEEHRRRADEIIFTPEVASKSKFDIVAELLATRDALEKAQAEIVALTADGIKTIHTMSSELEVALARNKDLELATDDDFHWRTRAERAEAERDAALARITELELELDLVRDQLQYGADL